MAQKSSFAHFLSESMSSSLITNYASKYTNCEEYVTHWQFIARMEQLGRVCSAFEGPVFTSANLILNRFSLPPRQHVSELLLEKLRLKCAIFHSEGYV